ncbi:hypothetical protein [Bosea sp. RAC05]|uniref:hypothetical protein n=1 Tax=Bosea sp. RAC05 TaxID=1842539 RepID=UPI00083E35D1|nr:hypothetical protein [Bosea sp. RAC05]AOG03426.1 hypothetical protein BSY19_5019 [Bosea sp. RAC05]
MTSQKFRFVVKVPENRVHEDIDANGCIETFVELDPQVELLDQLEDAMRTAQKNVASRFVDYDEINNDSRYLDELDRHCEEQVIISLQIGDAADKRVRWSAEAHHSEDIEEGTWLDAVMAASDEEADLIMRFEMAKGFDVPGKDKGVGFDQDSLKRTSISSFVGTMAEVVPISVFKEPISLEDFRAKVAIMVRAAHAEGLDIDGLADVTDLLREFGDDVEPARTPGMG